MFKTSFTPSCELLFFIFLFFTFFVFSIEYFQSNQTIWRWYWKIIKFVIFNEYISYNHDEEKAPNKQLKKHQVSLNQQINNANLGTKSQRLISRKCVMKNALQNVGIPSLVWHTMNKWRQTSCWSCLLFFLLLFCFTFNQKREKIDTLFQNPFFKNFCSFKQY